MTELIEAIIDGEEQFIIGGDLIAKYENNYEFKKLIESRIYYSCKFANKIIIIFNKNWEELFIKECKILFPDSVTIDNIKYDLDANGLMGGGYRLSYYNYKLNESIIDIIRNTKKEVYQIMREKLIVYQNKDNKNE